jgi:hypothetical protein
MTPPRLSAYDHAMTALFDHAVEAARSLPSSTQDEVARLLLQLAGEEQPPVEMSDAEMATFETSLAQAGCGERATDEQVSAVWAKYGL